MVDESTGCSELETFGHHLATMLLAGCGDQALYVELQKLATKASLGAFIPYWQ